MLAAAVAKSKRIVVMAGAGISVSAGIPDFRTPGTGLYDNLQKYKLPRPEAIFSLDFFRANPMPFLALSKDWGSGKYRPTPTHKFIAELARRGKLRRCFTQNIDGLELEAGLDPELLVQAHGGYSTASCIDCRKCHDAAFFRDEVRADRIPTCSCGGYVKPDIVFFGEALPDRFARLASRDFRDCDLLLVMGTSLAVEPFGSLITRAPEDARRFLINRERVRDGGARFRGLPAAFAAMLRATSSGFNFEDDVDNPRDVFVGGDCDDAVAETARLLGWQVELAPASPSRTSDVPEERDGDRQDPSAGGDDAERGGRSVGATRDQDRERAAPPKM